MLSSQEYVSLEEACVSLKASSLTILQEIARQILAVVIPESEFSSETICVVEGEKCRSDFAITYADIGSYLMAATGKYVPVLLETAFGAVESRQVFVRRDWLGGRLSVAKESLRLNASIAEPAANQAVSLAIAARVNSSMPAHWVDQPAPMSAAGHKNLRKWLEHQNDQRKANESASKLAVRLLEATARAEKAELIADARSAEINVLLNRDRLQIMEISTLQRTVQSLTLQNKKLKETAEDSATLTKPKKSTAKSRARAAAREMASSRWKLPDFKDYRVGDMAHDVWAEMSVEGSEHKNAMPLHYATVVDWLKEEKIPEAASRPGRPLKAKK